MANDVKYKVEAGFFDSIAEDRTYSADDMNRPYRRLISNGVFATPAGEPSNFLQVFSASDGMNIKVSAGYALIGDKWFENPSDLLITISRNSELLTRIDSIIAQVDKTQAGREGSIVYRQGSASSNPVHPEINTDEDIAEFRLADIVISPSCVEITQDLITDYRGSSECPWVTSLIKQVDTSTLYAQWQEAYKKYYDDQVKEHDAFFEESKEDFNTFKAKSAQEYQTWFTAVKQYCTEQEEAFNKWFEKVKQDCDQKESDFDEWFETIKGKLSGDVATNLQNQVDDLKKTKIIVSEEEPQEEECIWYQIVNSKPIPSEIAEIMVEVADKYDENSTYQLETITNMTDNKNDENKIIESEE